MTDERPTIAEPDEQIAAEESVALAILREIHSNIPENDRPMSWSDLSTDQEIRIRASARAAFRATKSLFSQPRPAAEWREDMGPVLWWRVPISEPPWVGTPLDLGHTVEISAATSEPETPAHAMRIDVGGWREGYYTHWTPLIVPSVPV